MSTDDTLKTFSMRGYTKNTFKKDMDKALCALNKREDIFRVIAYNSNPVFLEGRYVSNPSKAYNVGVRDYNKPRTIIVETLMSDSSVKGILQIHFARAQAVQRVDKAHAQPKPHLQIT